MQQYLCPTLQKQNKKQAKKQTEPHLTEVEKRKITEPAYLYNKPYTSRCSSFVVVIPSKFQQRKWKKLSSFYKHTKHLNFVEVYVLQAQERAISHEDMS